MTEQDVLEMEREVAKTEVSPQFEATWINSQLITLMDQEKKLVVAWKFHRLMRNDEDMRAVFGEITKAREAITVLTARLGQLMPTG